MLGTCGAADARGRLAPLAVGQMLAGGSHGLHSALRQKKVARRWRCGGRSREARTTCSGADARGRLALAASRLTTEKSRKSPKMEQTPEWACGKWIAGISPRPNRTRVFAGRVSTGCTSLHPSTPTRKDRVSGTPGRGYFHSVPPGLHLGRRCDDFDFSGAVYGAE
jgi:hypothetical protein